MHGIVMVRVGKMSAMDFGQEVDEGLADVLIPCPICWNVVASTLIFVRFSLGGRQAHAEKNSVEGWARSWACSLAEG